MTTESHICVNVFIFVNSYIPEIAFIGFNIKLFFISSSFLTNIQTKTTNYQHIIN